MPDYRALARQIARNNGIPEDLFLRLVQQESGFNPGARSGAGAIGLTQLMPGTARGLGVDPLNPIQNLRGGARYLADQYKRFGRWDLALSAYNSGPGGSEGSGRVEGFGETQRYVKNILGGRSYQPTVQPKPGAAKGVQRLAKGLDPTLAAIFEANNELLGVPGLNLGELLSTMQSHAGVAPSVPAPVAAGPRSPGRVSIAGGADRQGVKTGQGILQFAQQVAGVYGKPLRITTGTNHSQMTVNGRQSAHWTGNAVDIAASGAALTRMGRAALIAAGMDPKQARKVKGGLFNIGGRQIIFNTRQGGNHWNHLHIGLRG